MNELMTSKLAKLPRIIKMLLMIVKRIVSQAAIAKLSVAPKKANFV